MNRLEKQKALESLKADFAHSQASFLVEVKGLTVNKMQKLRKALYQHGVMKIAKNTLAKIASQDIEGAQNLHPYLKEQVALIFAPTEPSVVAKIICNFAKEEGALKIVAGVLGRDIVDKNKILFLGSLPTREVLMARIAGSLQSPIVRIAWALKQRSEKVE